MKWFVVSLLAALSSVHGAAVSYPYRSALLSYSPSRGEFPVQNALATGYLKLTDPTTGSERLLSFSYPEPLLAVRSQTPAAAAGSSPNLFLRSSISDGYSQENQKELMENFRVWCEERYNALKTEVERFRLEGKQPPAEMLAQLQPLETLLSSSQIDSINENLEVKKAREEHLRLWNEARLRLETEQKRLTEQHSKLSQSMPLATIEITSVQPKPVEETAEQKRLREEHLRIHQEQLKQAEISRLRLQNAKGNVQIGHRFSSLTKPAKANTESEIVHATEAKLKAEKPLKPKDASQSQSQSQIVIQNGQVQETPEVMKAKEEHFRLWNEAKLRAEEADRKILRQQQEISQISNSNEQSQNQNQDQSQTEAQIRYQAPAPLPTSVKAIQSSQPLQQFSHSSSSESIKRFDLNFGVRSDAPAIAPSSAQSIQPLQQSSQSSSESIKRYDLNFGVRSDAFTSQNVHDTPEVIRAREEHLKAVNEAKLKLQSSGSYQSQDSAASSIQQSQGSILKLLPVEQQAQAQPQAQTQAINPLGEAPKPVEDTPEVKKAREEHLRLFNEAQRLALQQQQIQNNKLENSPAFLFKTSQFSNEGSFLSEEDRLLEIERLRAEESLAEEERLREERLLAAERERESERLRLEERIREEERLKEIERIREEERFQTEENSRLQREEAERRELERLGEEQRLRKESKLDIKSQNKKLIPSVVPVAQPAFLQTFSQPQQISTSFNLNDKINVNPFVLRISGQPNGISAFASGTVSGSLNQQPAGVYIPSSQNPFLIRYIDNSIRRSDQKADSLPKAPAKSKPFQQAQAYLVPGIPAPNSYVQQPSQPFGPNLKLNYGQGSGLSELERATREHFRAHEVALEQLRLANQNRPYNKDCDY